MQISMRFSYRQRYCTSSSSGRQPNFAALNRGRHLCSAGRPSGWALAHILVSTVFLLFDVPEYSNTFDYIKDTRPAVYFDNQKIIAYHL